MFEKSLQTSASARISDRGKWSKAMDSHEGPDDYARPPIVEKLEIKHVPKPRIQLDAHVEIVDERACNVE